MLEQPIPTRYALAVYDALVAEGIECEMEKDIYVEGDDGETVHYRADIWIPSVCLDIEIDGSHHEVEPQYVDDVIRETLMEANGIALKRFWNWEVYNDLQQVVDSIKDSCEELENFLGEQ